VNPSSEAQERFVVRERVRLERVKAAHPLRPGAWRLARHGGGDEIALGIARDVRIGADLARLQVAEPLPEELAALLVPGAVEGDQVQVRIEPQICRRASCRAEGTPEQVAAVKESYTGRFLGPLLPKASARRSAR
jgi:hypothetical protein